MPPPAGSRPVPAAPTAGREIPVPQGLRFSAYRPAAFFAPARDVKAAASPRPPNFHGPIGKTAGQAYQTTISDSGISFAGITPESPGTVGNITDGSGCGTASIAEACRRVRAPIKLTEYGAHAIGSSKRYGAALQGSPEARPCCRAGKTSIPNTVYNSRRAIAAASRGAGTGTPHCARVCSGRFAGRAAAGSAFVSGQAAANPGGISGKPAARNAHFSAGGFPDTPSWPPFASATSVSAPPGPPPAARQESAVHRRCPDSAAYHTCFAEFRRCRWRGPAPIASGMPFLLLGRRKLAVVALQRRRSIAVQGVKQRCKAFVAPAVNRVSVVSVGIVHARQRTFRHAPRQPLRRQRLGKVTLAHHIVDIRLLLGAVGVLVHPARTAVIAGLQLCQSIVVVLLQQIAAVCICLVQVSHVFVIGGLRRLLFCRASSSARRAAASCAACTWASRAA